MRRILCAGVAAVTLVAAAPRPAEAWFYGYGPGAVFAGAALGVATGAVIAGAVRPYYYGYPYYPYPYYYPAPVYAAPYPYAYPPPPYPAAYPPPAYAPAAAPRPAPPAPAPHCRAGQFYNSLTGSCDTR